MTSEPANPCAIDEAADLAGQRFRSQFEQRAVRIPELVHPGTARAVRPDDPPRQETIFRFGDIVRYNFRGGFKLSKLDLSHSQLSLIGLRLGGEGVQLRDGRCGPSRGVFRLFPDAFNFKDTGYYIVGVFSPFGWPDLWTGQDHGGANFEIHLVERQAGGWRVYGPPNRFRGLFDPESAEDKKTRLLSALKADARLAAPTAYVALDAFCEEHALETGFVTRTLEAELLGYQVIAHRGHAVIQRSFR